ncbi:MAG: hypothetical protein ABW198_06245 [Pseudorhodoplanes sp.]
MSYSYALAGERFSSGLSRRWLFACTLSQLICLGALSAGGALAQRMQWLTGSPEMIGLSLLTAAVFGLTYGYMRGSVLRAGLARFPLGLWCLAAAAVALVITPPVPAAIPDFTTSGGLTGILRALSPDFFKGLFYGLVVGCVEAFVMRRAAFGLAVWVLLSGFAWAVVYAAVTLCVTLASGWQPGSTFLWSLMMAPLVAFLILPAIHNLTPQLSYYGPRVYRPLLRTQR